MSLITPDNLPEVLAAIGAIIAAIGGITLYRVQKEPPKPGSPDAAAVALAENTKALQAMAESDSFDALIALGCIIRGETYHFELVANESGAGVTRLSLDYQIPIANAIITTENMEQAIARQSDKGTDAARVAVEMANLLDELS